MKQTVTSGIKHLQSESWNGWKKRKKMWWKSDVKPLNGMHKKKRERLQFNFLIQL